MPISENSHVLLAQETIKENVLIVWIERNETQSGRMDLYSYIQQLRKAENNSSTFLHSNSPGQLVLRVSQSGFLCLTGNKAPH